MKYWVPLIIAINFGISPSTYADSSCPKNFTTFLDRFSEDRAFQDSHTKYPVTYISNNGYSDKCYPDCPIVKDHLSRKQAVALADPIYPLSSTQALVPLTRKIETFEHQIVVRLDKPDSDSFSFGFTFQRNVSCWELIAVQDMSI